MTMKNARFHSLICLVILIGAAANAAEPVHFARDVLPVLSANCFACHGPDEHERQADLRLDLESESKKARGDKAAIKPGDPDNSLIVERMLSHDPDRVMPPPKSRKTVTPEQIRLIRSWIADGARWERHWSFEPVVKLAGSIDQIVRSSLKKRGLPLRPAATPQALVRRLSLDLIGLPPSIEMADAFAKSPTAENYERLIDDLLKSPRFGEHWARMWLDLARYADTKGYEKDLGRTMWPYRDWVIAAFNSDMPLDQFTLEQLAGDLLPNPTEQQVIATAFHRNTMSNDEGGTDDEEFRVAAVKDRVDTTIQIWMGLTMGCAKCHSHKYDPISNEDYYRFYAIFNQTEDADRYDDAPRLEVVTPEQRLQREQLQVQVSQLKSDLAKAEQLAENMDPSGKVLWTSPQVTAAKSTEGATLTVMPEQSVTVSGKSEAEDVYTLTLSLRPGTYTALRLEALPTKMSDGTVGLGRNPGDPNFVVSELRVERLDGVNSIPITLKNARSDFAQGGWPVTSAIDGDTKTGWAVSPRSRERHVAFFDLAEPLKLEADTSVQVTLVQAYGNRLTLAHFRLSVSTADSSQLTLQPDDPNCRALRDQLAAAEKTLTSYTAELAVLPIMRELPAERQRVTKIHKRGNFLEQGDAVTPALLSRFHSSLNNGPVTRIQVAKWLVNSENPLTPRVWANRIWSRLFGVGIVETEEDFGALGSPPSNQELLDWLAAEYRDNGWSLKKLLKAIVRSDTYRQASESSGDLQSIDPRNGLFSRGARFRLSAEVVRDQALAVAGMLSQKMGDPPVMPPQPAGMWRSTYNGKTWIDAEGEDRVRRSLYTYLKRTTPYPSFTTFDAGSGEVCQIRRIRTNTPLQALVTLNDPVYLEAAAGLARRMLDHSNDPKTCIEYGMRLALIRPLRPGESEPLVRLQRDLQRQFAVAPEQAASLIKTSRGKPADTDPAAFASWIVTANTILNLDEVLTRN
jgi:mono/diheme cytochrome c family protein